MVIGGSKVFVDEQGGVSGFESLQRVGPGQSERNCHDTSTSSETFESDDAIEAYEDILRGDHPAFLDVFSGMEVGKQRTVEEILGCDDSEGFSESEHAINANEGDFNNIATMLLYKNHSQYGRHKREKKKRVKEKRLQRMLSRGFSLEFLDGLIRNFVIQQNDMYSLPPMSKMEVEQVRKLASLYKCKCSLQGTCSKKGKKQKNVLVLIATNDMEIPKGKLEEERNRMFGLEKAAFEKLQGNAPTSQIHAKVKSKKESNLHRQKISFVSDGYIDPEKSIKTEDEDIDGETRKSPVGQQDLQPSLEGKPMAMMTKSIAKALEKKRKKDERRRSTSDYCRQSSDQSDQTPYASFEKHTTGIGSKLLSKWGFEKGVHGGLGKKNDGVAEPIKVISRPKGLGLGAK